MTSTIEVEVDFGSPETLLAMADETKQLAKMCRGAKLDNIAEAYSKLSDAAVLAASNILLLTNEFSNEIGSENVVDKDENAG